MAKPSSVRLEARFYMDYSLVQSKGQVWRPFFLNFGALPTDCPPKIWLLSSLCATWSKPIIPHPYPLFGACTGTEFGVATVFARAESILLLWADYGICGWFLQKTCKTDAQITGNNINSCSCRYPLCSGYTFYCYHFPPFTPGSTTVQTKLTGDAY